MTDTAIFSFARAADDVVSIRSVLMGGEPWFVASDICTALGLNYRPQQGVTKFLTGLDAKDRLTVNRNTIGLGDAKHRGSPNIVLISEAGVYRLTMRPEKAEAVVFPDWIASEVLPSIRKPASIPWPTTAARPCRCPWTTLRRSRGFRRRSLLGSLIRADIYKREAFGDPPRGGPSVILEVPQGLRGHVLYLSTRPICCRRAALGEADARLPSWPYSAAVPDG